MIYVKEYTSSKLWSVEISPAEEFYVEINKPQKKMAHLILH